ncbi:glucoamylase family protein [Olivibacter sp. CPCC 100613]|uniref:glucoamylase family protein n=1 Tax=Olivibacter sp. CPCC 100613 TaxID=3079931 RepID=UPI002FF7FB70
MNKIYFFLLAFLLSIQAEASNYPEVLFENSLMPKSYYYSQSSFQGNSWINHMNGHLPVADSVFFTPGNSLMLNYISGNSGEWQSAIHYSDDYGHLPKNNDLLIFKIFVSSATAKAELPSIQLAQGENISEEIKVEAFVKNYQDNAWLSIEIPLKDIGNLDNQAPISSIIFKQGANRDGKEHRLFIDQIEFLPNKTPDMKLTGKAVLSSVEAHERHVDIVWQLPLTPSIRYIKIYRSEDNRNFSPVAVRPISFNKYTDFVPRTNVSYYYKIAWVDYRYRESPFSDVKTAETKLANDDDLLNSIEKSHIAYFTNETEFNSGMHKISPLVSEASVSVKGTGIGILAQVIGVERKFIPRQLLLDRLKKIVRFLGKATTYHGAFPELLDGRSGKPIMTDSCEIAANIESTAYLMQGLLVARNYFDKEESDESELREAITSLWKNVDWKKFVKDESGYHLYNAWSPACSYTRSSPIGGYNSSLIAYLLAIASPSHAISQESYNFGFKQPLKYIGPAIGRLSTSLNDTLIVGDSGQKPELYSREPFMIDSTYYGVRLMAGSVQNSLIEQQQPFLAFNPKNLVDSSINYFDNQRDLSNVYYRAALDRSEQFVSITNLLWPYVGRDSASVNRFNPSAAIATYPYTPTIALEALKNYYRNLGNLLWTEYGFRDEFNFKDNWVSGKFDPVHQGIVPIMLENARTGLIWNLFMKDPDIKSLVDKMK